MASPADLDRVVYGYLRKKNYKVRVACCQPLLPRMPAPTLEGGSTSAPVCISAGPDAPGGGWPLPPAVTRARAVPRTRCPLTRPEKHGLPLAGAHLRARPQPSRRIPMCSRWTSSPPMLRGQCPRRPESPTSSPPTSERTLPAASRGRGCKPGATHRVPLPRCKGGEHARPRAARRGAGAGRSPAAAKADVRRAARSPGWRVLLFAATCRLTSRTALKSRTQS